MTRSSNGHPFMDMPAITADMRGVPTVECVCGNRIFFAVVWFDDDYEVGGYVTDGLCPCGVLLTLATPLDRRDLYDLRDIDGRPE